MMDLEKLKSELRRDEGLKLYPYKCTAGHWTAGYGRNLEAMGYPDHEIERLKKTGILINEAERWLDEDARQAVEDAAKFFPEIDQLSDNRQRVIANMAFNMGLKGLRKFKLFRQALMERDFERAVYEMKNSKWYWQVGRRSIRLVKRMKDG